MATEVRRTEILNQDHSRIRIHCVSEQQETCFKVRLCCYLALAFMRSVLARNGGHVGPLFSHLSVVSCNLIVFFFLTQSLVTTLWGSTVTSDSDVRAN